MNLADKISARRFMAGESPAIELGAEVCASCGVDRATERTSRVMNSTFNQVQWLLCDSLYICQRCLDLFRDKTSRSKCLYFSAPGRKRIIEREEVLPLLADPPDFPYVLCLPYSFQKHVFFHAGISTRNCAWISTDDRVVRIDYQKHDIRAIADQLGEMLVAGVPRREVSSGAYSIFTRARFGSQLDVWEGLLTPLRPDGAIELLVTYSPSTKEKIKYEVEPMAFSETESKAIEILMCLARSSEYRMRDGMSFWGSYFRRRINRNLRKKDLHIFFSAVASDIGCSSMTLDTLPLADMDADMSGLVLEELRGKTELLIAAAFAGLREKQTSVKEKKKGKEILNANTLF